MRWAGRFAFVVTLASLVTCTPLDQGSSRLVRQAPVANHHLVSGVGTRDSGMHTFNTKRMDTDYNEVDTLTSDAKSEICIPTFRINGLYIF